MSSEKLNKDNQYLVAFRHDARRAIGILIVFDVVSIATLIYLVMFVPLPTK